MASAAAFAPGPRLARPPPPPEAAATSRARPPRPSRPPAPATADVDTRTARELVAWLTVEKGLPGGAAKAVSFGDGGVAKLVNDVRAGEPLIEIPQNLAVTSVDVADSPIVAGLAAGRGELVGLALWLCLERHKGPLSEWAPYVATLPSAGSDHPLLWTAGELQTLLQGPPVREQAVSRLESADDEYASIADQIRSNPNDFPPDAYEFLTRDAFVDALATVLARAVWLNAANCYAMVPLVDLLPLVGSPPPGVSRRRRRVVQPSANPVWRRRRASSITTPPPSASRW